MGNDAVASSDATVAGAEEATARSGGGSAIMPDVAVLLGDLGPRAPQVNANTAHGVLSDRADLSAFLSLVAATPAARIPHPDLFVRTVAPNVNRGDFVPAFSQPAPVALPILRSQKRAPAAEKTVLPRPDAKGGATLSSPKTAGLITSGLSFGLETLERALRAFTEPAAHANGRSGFLPHWLGASLLFLGCALAYLAARRRRSRPALPGVGPTDELRRPPEDLS